MDEFAFILKDGKVVDVQAKTGESVLRRLIKTDKGASHLGEIALVPNSSLVSQMDLLFYSILVDENAASHIALGSSYKFSIEGGREMTDEEFTAKGGNPSVVHIDFMFGSENMDVDGITKDAAVEPIMRAGEWTFEV